MSSSVRHDSLKKVTAMPPTAFCRHWATDFCRSLFQRRSSRQQRTIEKQVRGGSLTTGSMSDSDYLVGVHAGSGSPTKCWSSDRFARVVDGLHKSAIKVVLIEGPADKEVTQAVVRRIPIALPRLHDVSLSSVVGVLSQCDSFLGNDSGLTRIAAALGLPTVAVFGPTDPAIWGTRRKNLVTLRRRAVAIA